MAPQFNLLRDGRWGRSHRIAETAFDLGETWITLRVGTWKGVSYYHLSKVKGYIPDVYN